MGLPNDMSVRSQRAEEHVGETRGSKTNGQAYETAPSGQPLETPQMRYDFRVLQSLRRIMRALHLHSRKLAAEYDITGPQLFCLMTIAQENFLTVSSIARRVHLSSSTVIGILDRLEKRGLIVRQRDSKDRRLVDVMATEAGRQLVEAAPSPLQESMARELLRLPELEQSTIALSLERIVDLMEAKEVEAAPLLDMGTAEQELPKKKNRDTKEG